MALAPRITIDLDDYDRLCEDSESFKRIKKGETYVHFYHSYTLGGRYTEVTSNDERFKAVHEEVERMKKKMSDLHNEYNLRIKAEAELKQLKSKGFFKRLFS